MRLNLVPVKILTDQHLIAERRELRMIPPLLQKKFDKQGQDLRQDIPAQFTLGTGHMNFWLDKIQFLEQRFISLTGEMIVRGFNPDKSLMINTYLAEKEGFYKTNWKPKSQDIKVSAERIYSKILEKPHWYKFFSLPISVEWITSLYEPLMK